MCFFVWSQQQKRRFSHQILSANRQWSHPTRPALAQHISTNAWHSWPQACTDKSVIMSLRCGRLELPKHFKQHKRLASFSSFFFCRRRCCVALSWIRVPHSSRSGFNKFSAQTMRSIEHPRRYFSSHSPPPARKYLVSWGWVGEKFMTLDGQWGEF